MDRWPNQQRAFDLTLDAIRRGVNRICVTSPTGSGKTRMMTDLIQWGVSEGKRVALYTQRKMLYEQTAAVLERAGIDFGKRASGHETALLRAVQLCMTPTELSRVYQRGDRELHAAGLVLIDECHAQTGGAMRKILDDHVADNAVDVGYTATALDVGDIYDELIVAGYPSECRAFGALVPAETYAPDEPDLKHIKNYKVGEDLTEKDNAKAIMRPGVFGRIVKAWQEHNPEHKPTILFAPDVRGSIFFAEQFTKAGIPAAHIDGDDVWIGGQFYKSNQEQRELVRDLLMAGDIKLVCNRFVLREGIDWPFIECGILATVFGALSSYLQSVGRLLRVCRETGKQSAILLDHGGNWWRHGSANEDREWFLGLTNHRAVGERLERMREKKLPEPIVCPQCGKVRNGGRQCPVCGHIAHRKSRLVVQVDGTLKAREGDIMRPRRVKREPDTQQKWTRIYHRAKSAKWNATFRQAEAMFFLENFYYPPRDLPLMPQDSGDWWRKVRDVPKEALI